MSEVYRVDREIPELDARPGDYVSVRYDSVAVLRKHPRYMATLLLVNQDKLTPVPRPGSTAGPGRPHLELV